jgi:hypothetical protein
MGEVQTLEYGRHARKRNVRLSVCLFVIALISFAIWSCHESIVSYLEEKYSAFQFAYQYDRAARALTGDGETWIATSVDSSADKYLDGLLGASPDRLKEYWDTSHGRVLFVRAGKTNGHPWLAFACDSFSGLETFTFSKSDRFESGYDSLYETPQFWKYVSDKNTGFKIEVVKGQRQGSGVETTLKVNGVANSVYWTIKSATTPIATSRIALESRQVSSSATPISGWISGDKWWPNCDEFQLLNGSPASVQVPSVFSAAGDTFVPDGRIALVTPTEMRVIDPVSTAVVSHPFVRSLGYLGHAAFSPDGLHCYIGYDNGDSAMLIDTLNDNAKTVGGRIILGKPNFLNNNELILYGSGFLRHVDAITGQTEFLGKSNISDAVRGGGREAFTSFNSDQVRVVGADGVTLCSFDKIDRQYGMALSPNGRWLMLAGKLELDIYDVDKRQNIWRHEEDLDLSNGASKIKWSADGSRGAVAGNQFVYVWSMNSPRCVVRFPNAINTTDVALSADGRQMAAVAGWLKTIAYWPDLNAIICPK